MRGILPACLSLMLLAPALAEEREAQLGSDMVNPGHVPHPEWFKQSFLDLNEDIEEAAAEGRHLALYFYQDGCPYCKLFVENGLGQHDIAEYAQEHFDFIGINLFGSLEVTDVDGQALPEGEFAMKIQAMFTPTVLIYGEDGAVVFRMNGYYPPPKLRAVLRFVAGRHYKTQRFVEYYRNEDQPASSGELHADTSTLDGPPFDLSDRESGKPLLVMFEQKECLGCDELHQDIFQRPETREILDRFDRAVLDIRANETLVTPAGHEASVPTWARDVGVKTVPTQVMYDAQGAEVFRNEGYVKAFHVQSILDYVASGAYRTERDFQAFIQQRADRLHEAGVAVNLME